MLIIRHSERGLKNQNFAVFWWKIPKKSVFKKKNVKNWKKMKKNAKKLQKPLDLSFEIVYHINVVEWSWLIITIYKRIRRINNK